MASCLGKQHNIDLSTVNTLYEYISPMFYASGGSSEADIRDEDHGSRGPSESAAQLSPERSRHAATLESPEFNGLYLRQCLFRARKEFPEKYQK
jgi:hypothetical protein